MPNWFQRLFRHSSVPAATPPEPSSGGETAPLTLRLGEAIIPIVSRPASALPTTEPRIPALVPSPATVPPLPLVPEPVPITRPRPEPAYRPPDAATQERISEDQRRDRHEFGEELRGVGAKQRGAVTELARLNTLGLPIFHTEQDLARWLGISLARLRWYTYDNPADTTWHYTRWTIKKRNGGERVILAPKRELKALQRKVLAGIVARVPVAATTHGFVPGRSTVTNARVHAGRSVVLKLDLKDFFPNITYPRVRGLFISLGYSYPVAATLALLCTEYDREAFTRAGTRHYVSIGPRHLVQGAPTSPGLANLVAWKLDRRLGGLAAKRGFAFTRYADDLTFSGDDRAAVDQLRGLARRIIDEEHFTVNSPKTRVAPRSARQVVTGLVVNEATATPRALRRRLRAILHNAQRTGLEAQNRDHRDDFAAYLRGMIAYIQGVQPRHATRLRGALERVETGNMTGKGDG